MMPREWGGTNWNSEAKIAVSTGGKSWIVEMAIPFARLGAGTPPQGTIWGLNLCREEKALKEISSWAGLKTNFHSPDKFGELIFGGDVPVTLKKVSSDDLLLGDNVLTALVKNQSGRQEVVALAAEIASSGGEKINIARTMLKAGEEKIFKLNYRLENKGKNEITFSLYDPKTNEIYYACRRYGRISGWTGMVKTASNSNYTLYLNGQKAADYHAGTGINKFPWHLKQGINVIGIRCRKNKDDGRLLAAVNVSGHEKNIVSDTGWKCSAGPTATVENLLSNPGFEEADRNDDQPKCWSRFKVQGGLADTDMKGERTSEDCHSGKAAYKITGTARAGMK
ncbi:MAG: hypothetical protein PHV82_03615, partial [Victivallaceae bacterium]|nr:hypothetical protein [Victivallaceae bacterium]